MFSSQLGMQAASNTHLLLLQYGNGGHGGRGKQLAAAAAAAAAGNGGEGLFLLGVSFLCTPTRLCLSTFVTQYSLFLCVCMCVCVCHSIIESETQPEIHMWD